MSHKAAVVFSSGPIFQDNKNHTLRVDEIKVENEQGVVKQDIFMEKKC